MAIFDLLYEYLIQDKSGKRTMLWVILAVVVSSVVIALIGLVLRKF